MATRYRAMSRHGDGPKWMLVDRRGVPVNVPMVICTKHNVAHEKRRKCPLCVFWRNWDRQAEANRRARQDLQTAQRLKADSFGRRAHGMSVAMAILSGLALGAYLLSHAYFWFIR